MYVPIKYTATAFVDADSIAYEHDAVRDLLEVLGDTELAPSRAVELDASGKAKPRFAFSHWSNGTKVALLSKRFTVERGLQSADTSDMDDLGKFCEYASDMLTKLLENYGRQSHRLALVCEGLYTDLDAGTLGDVTNRLFRLPEKTDEPFEWNWRVANQVERSFGTNTEDTNTIIHLLRAHVSTSPLGFQGAGIVSALDINTSPENRIARFGKEGIEAYFQAVSEWMNDLREYTYTFMFGDEDD